MNAINHRAFSWVSPEVEFIFRDGKRIRNVPELVEVISGCSDDDFTHHVNENKNDFAVWIRDAVGDLVLYESFRNEKAKEQTISHLKSYLKKVEAKPGIIQKLSSNNPALKKIVEKLRERMREDAVKLNTNGQVWLNAKYSVKDIMLSSVIGALVGIVITVAAIV